MGTGSGHECFTYFIYLFNAVTGAQSVRNNSE